MNLFSKRWFYSLMTRIKILKQVFVFSPKNCSKQLVVIQHRKNSAQNHPEPSLSQKGLLVWIKAEIKDNKAKPEQKLSEKKE